MRISETSCDKLSSKNLNGTHNSDKLKIPAMPSSGEFNFDFCRFESAIKVFYFA